MISEQKPLCLLACAGNLGSFENVLIALSDHFKMIGSFVELVLFVEPLIGQDLDPFVSLFELTVGPGTIVAIKHLLNPAHELPGIVASAVRKYGADSVVVDITTGTKTTSSVLYACVTLAQLPNVVYVAVPRSPEGSHFRLSETGDPSGHYSVHSMCPPLDGLSDLAALTFFDLVFLMKEIELLEVATETLKCEKKDSLCKSIFYLREAMVSFFGNDPNGRLVFQKVGLANECLMKYVVSEFQGRRSMEVNDLKGLPSALDKVRGKGGLAHGPLSEWLLDFDMQSLRTIRNATSHQSTYDSHTEFDVRIAIYQMLRLCRYVSGLENEIPRD